MQGLALGATSYSLMHQRRYETSPLIVYLTRLVLTSLLVLRLHSHLTLIFSIAKSGLRIERYSIGLRLHLIFRYKRQHCCRVIYRAAGAGHVLFQYIFTPCCVNMLTSGNTFDFLREAPRGPVKR